LIFFIITYVIYAYMNKRRYEMNKSTVCRIGNKLAAQGENRKDAFVRQGAVEVKTAGTSFGCRPEALARLAAYNPAQVRAVLMPEPENPVDPQALVVMVGVQNGRGLFRIGYVPRKAVPIVSALRVLLAVRVAGDTVKGLRFRFVV
jgi:hypothetical protein